MNRLLPVGLILTLLVLALPPPSLVSADEEIEDPLRGLPIVRIVFIRNNIFDTSNPKTSAWFYRGANAINVITREGFIRSMLLFSEGDRYSPGRAVESARILRSLGFLNPVNITARPLAADGQDGVEITVETFDRWTFEIGAELGLFGDRSDDSVAFVEENFWGWGREISIEYESDNERDSWTYAFFDPNVLGQRWRARIQREESSDGSADLWRVEYPFYSLSTSHTWGIQWTRKDAEEHLYSESETTVLGRHLHDGWYLWGGFRLAGNGDVTRRLVAGYEHRRERYRDWAEVGDEGAEVVVYPSPEKQRIEGIRLNYEQISNHFEVLYGFRAWSKQEDVAMGPNMKFGFTASLPSLGADKLRFLANGSFATARHRGNWLFLGKAWFETRIENGGVHNGLVGVQLAAAELGKRGWQARLRMENIDNPDSNSQLTLGADTGLRGWDPDYFDGTGRVVANIQWRTLLVEDLGELFSLGVVAFADAGHTWGARVGQGTQRVRFDAGIGLLVDLTNIGRARLLRIDLACPDDNSGWVVTATSSTLF